MPFIGDYNAIYNSTYNAVLNAHACSHYSSCWNFTLFVFSVCVLFLKHLISSMKIHLPDFELFCYSSEQNPQDQFHKIMIN